MTSPREIVAGPEPAGSVPAPRRHLLALVVLWAVVSLPALRMGIHADDWFHLRPRGVGEVLAAFAGDWNSGVRGAGGFYRPLARASFSLDAALFGRFAPGPHATSALGFLAVVLGVRAVAMQLTGGGERCSTAAAALVAASPLKSEALYWISARGDLLAAAFGIWSLWFALRSVGRPSARDAGASLALLACALLSKEVAAAFVLIVPFAVLLLRQPVPWGRTDVALVAGPLAMGGAWVWLRAALLGGVGGYYGASGEPLAVPGMLANLGAMLSALAAPATGFALGHWLSMGAPAWLGGVWLILMGSRLRRSYVLCAGGVVAALLPMAGLPVTPLDGTRVLLVALCFHALLAGVLLAQLSRWGITRCVGTVLLAVVLLLHTASSLGRAGVFLSAEGRNARVMRAAAARLAAARPGERFLLPDPPDPPGMQRYLAPGMSMLMAMQAESARAGRPALLRGVELLPGPGADAGTTPTLVLLSPGSDGALVESAHVAAASHDVGDALRAALPEGFALGGTSARIALHPMAPAGLHRFTLSGRGEQPLAPRVEFRGPDDRLAGSATAILSHADGDSWEVTAYGVTAVPFGTLVVAPTAAPRRFTLRGAVLDSHTPAPRAAD